MSASPIPLTQFPDALPIGTVLGDFTVTQVIGVGGFGIVYLAHDDVLHRTVAIKEYLPITIAGRTSAMTVLVRSTRQTDTYVAGLQSFMREARLQARFSHPAMLEVFQVWEQNGTAYMAMRYYPGESLLRLREQSASGSGADSAIPFDEDAIRRIMSPVFEGVSVLHADSVLHRDVSPDNILIMPSGASVLLDFGSARMVVMGAEQSLTTVLKPGYAPVEQYIPDGTMEQGAWTDVYALGAVLYFLAMGAPPPQAVSRMLRGTLDEFEETARGRFSARFISAVSASLTVQPTLRLPSVAAFRDALGWPDEPTHDALKSLLVTTMALPFNAEWRAAQIARQAEHVSVATPAASDAVTVLVSDPFANTANAADIADIAAIADSPDTAHIAPALPTNAPVVRRASVADADADADASASAPDVSRAPVACRAAAGAAEATPSTLQNKRQPRSALAWSTSLCWLPVVALAMLVTGGAMIAQTQSPTSTPTSTSPSPSTSASETISVDAAKIKVAPTLKLTDAVADEHTGSIVAAENAAPPVARLSATAAKKNARDGNIKSNAVPAAPAVAAVSVVPIDAINPISPVTSAASPGPSPVQRKSAACQRVLSKLAPSEAAIAQSDVGQVSDCK